MGAACGKSSGEGNEAAISGRGDAITGGAKAQAKGLPQLPQGAVKSHPDDATFIEVGPPRLLQLEHVLIQLVLTQESLSRLLVFSKLNPELQRKIVAEMHERTVQAGEILINEGDTGLAATELYVVKSGKFEVCLIYCVVQVK